MVEMHKLHTLVLIGTTAFAMASATLVAQAQTPAADQIIADRQAGFKKMSDEFGAMKKAIDAGQDVKPLAADAQDIANWGKKIPTVFPPGTESGHNTHATAAVWSDRSQFDTNAANLTAAADKLAQIAATGDKAAFADQWKAVGSTCGACHANQKFRTRI
jgi:cytochrome c556